MVEKVDVEGGGRESMTIGADSRVLRSRGGRLAERCNGVKAPGKGRERERASEKERERE